MLENPSGSFKNKNQTYSEKPDMLPPDGSMRRRILQVLLALGLSPSTALSVDAKEKAKSVLPEGIHIDSMEDLELLVEALQPAIQEDFDTQDRETEKLQRETGNPKAKADPINGEVFMASIEDFAERIRQMINPRGVMERMDKAIDDRLRRSTQYFLDNPASKEAVKEDIRAALLSDLFATKVIVRRFDDFWERIDAFDASVGKKSNRVPATPETPSARAEDHKVVEYLIKMTKGQKAVDEFIEKFHAKDPLKFGDLATRLSADVTEPFLFDYKVDSMVSLRD